MNIAQKILLVLSMGTAAQSYGIANAQDSRRCSEQTVIMTATDGCSGNYCTRSAFVCLPTAWWNFQSQAANIPSNATAPLVVAFHGRGKENPFDHNELSSDVQNYIANSPEAGMFAVSTNLHGEMPTAIVIYFQGVPTDKSWAPTQDSNFPRGWQVNLSSDANSNSDVKFVEKFLASTFIISNTSFKLKNYVNSKEVFAVGHSNGSRFIGVLWNHSSTENPLQRSNLKAVAFSAAQAGDFPDQGNGVIGKNLFEQADPVSIFMGMGRKDEAVPYAIQHPSIAQAKSLLGISEAENPIQNFTFTPDENLQVFENADGLKLATYIHPHFVWAQSEKTGAWIEQGHVWPTNLASPSINQEKLIAKFFGLQP